MKPIDQQNVPKLRFPGFEGAWQSKRAGDIYHSFPTKPYQILASSFERSGILPVIDQGKEKIAGYTSEEERAFSDVPIIVFGDHTTELKYIDFPFVVGADGTKLLKPKSSSDDTLFHFFSLTNYNVEQEGYKRHFSILRNQNIWFPHLSEQRKIAFFLGAVDTKIEQLTRKKVLLDDYKKGCMQQLLSQTIRFKDDSGKDFPDWVGKIFGTIVTRSKDKFDPQKEDSAPTLIELENIESRTGRVISASSLADQKSLKNRFRKGDVLFSKLRPYLRKYARPAFAGICTSEIWVLQSTEFTMPFLFYLVQSEQFIQLANLSTGSKMPRAEWSVIADSEFAVPHPDEQRKIADFLSAIDRKIDLVGQELEHAKTFKKGLLQQMFV